jgi:hypothetical protein
MRLGVFAYADSRDSQTGPVSGGLYGMRYREYWDVDRKAFAFRQVEIEAQQYVPYFNRARVLAFRAAVVLSFPKGDNAVPIVAHVGLIPSQCTWTGGFKAVGKTAESALAVWRHVKRLEAIGCFGAELEVVLGVEVDRVVLAPDLERGALEVEAGAELALRLVDRVVDLLQVELAHDVERGHEAGVSTWGASPRQPRAAG